MATGPIDTNHTPYNLIRFFWQFAARWKYSYLVALSNRSSGEFNCLRNVAFEIETKRPTFRQCGKLDFQISSKRRLSRL